MDKIISSEYQIDPHPNVENFPIVHLKVNEILKGQDIKINNFTIRDIDIHGNSCYILNYPVSKYQLINNTLIKFFKFNDTEYIIYVILKTEYEDNGLYPHIKKYLIYISNFGRFIKSTFYKPQSNGEPSSFCMLHNSQLVNYSYVGYNYNIQVTQHNLDLTYYTYYTSLEYRMPRLFIKILEAYNKENTDLLQECCKDYFMEYKKKNEEIELKNKIIEEKNAEIEKLKKEILELKKFYL